MLNSRSAMALSVLQPRQCQLARAHTHAHTHTHARTHARTHTHTDVKPPRSHVEESSKTSTEITQAKQDEITLYHTVYPRSEVFSRSFPLQRGPAGAGRSKISTQVYYTHLRKL